MVNKERSARLLEALWHNGATLHEKIGAYYAMNGLKIQEELTPGEILRNRLFTEMLAEARSRLSPEDQAYIKDVPIILSDRDYRTKERFSSTASSTHGGDAPASITFYRSIITNIASWEKYTREQYVDWIYRLFLHEIGHARDKRSDEAMAKESNY